MSETATDLALVERVQQGDKRAFDLLVKKYQHKVLTVVGRYISDHGEAQDVTQEAFIKAYRALPRFRGDSAFYTWIYRIAINTAKNYLVSRGRRPPASDIDVADGELFETGQRLRDVSSPEAQLLTDEIQRTIWQALDELSEDLRAALTLREFEGLSYEEIAEILGCPVGTVRSRIFRAREAIDAKLAPLIDNS
ncbi:MAG: RNA polymerase sigma factor RpoE [Pseudomonadales bacterium]|nr:RNA polymerase sigma factor RpoE [Pseudomonadales bacterium]